MDGFGADSQKLSKSVLLEEQIFVGGAGVEIGGKSFAEIEELILDVGGELIDGGGGEAVAHCVFADGEFACGRGGAG